MSADPKKTIPATDPTAGVTTNAPGPKSKVAKAGKAVTPAAAEETPAPRKVPVWADDLSRALAETGTGAGKLAVIAKAKVKHFGRKEVRHLPKDDPKRHLSAKQAARIMLDDPEVGDLTKDKIRQLMRDGKYLPAEVGPAKIDAHVPAPPDAAPVDDGDEEPWEEPEGDAPGEDDEPLEPGDEDQDDDEERSDRDDTGFVDDGANADDLEKLTVAELKDVAAGEGVELPPGAKKADIVAAIELAREGRG